MPEGRTALLLRIRRGLKDELASLAKREHRSLNQQIEFLLERSLSETTNTARPVGRRRMPPDEESAKE
jgi:hypothetical protein